MKRRLALIALLAACNTQKATPDAGNTTCNARPVDLLDARALIEDPSGKIIPTFDRIQPPRLRLRGQTQDRWRAVISSTVTTEVMVALETRTATASVEPLTFFSRKSWPDFSGSFTLAMQAADCPPIRTWAIRWREPPEALPVLAQIAPLKAEKKFGDITRVLSAQLAELDPWSRVWASVEIARAYGALGESDSALTAWKQSAEIALEANVPSQASWALRSAAFQAQWLRQYSEVGALLDRAEAIDRRIGNDIGLAKVLFYRGLLAQELGLYRRAERSLHAAARAAQALGRDTDEAGAVKSLAYLLRIEGRFEEALDALSRVEPHLRGLGEIAEASYSNEVGGVLLDAFEARGPTRLGRFSAQAEVIDQYFEHAEKLAAKNGAKQVEAVALLNRAWLRFWEDRLPEARALLRRIRALGQAQDLERVAAILLRAMMSLRERRLADAERGFRELDIAARDETGGGESDYTWRAAYGLGQVARARGDHAAAIAAHRSAIAILDRVARQTALQRGRAPFESDRRRVVEDAIALSLEAGRVSDAFEIADAAAARVLGALETEVRIARLDQNAKSRWEEKLAAYASRRERYDREREAQTLLAGAELRAWRSSRDVERRVLQQSFEDLYAWLDEAAPQIAPPSPSTTRLIEALKEGEALISYVRDGSAWRSFWVDRRGVRERRFDGDVLGPWRAELEQVEHLIVAPGAFPAAKDLPLLEYKGRALIERMRVTLVPHAGFVVRSTTSTSGPIVVVADPDGSLPGARAEGSWVANKLGVAPIVGDDITRSELLVRLKSAGVFHFSGHGQLRPANPWDAHLKLARGETLSVEDVLIASAGPRLVVLSGCETGVSQALSRDYSIGLPEAFLVAGARGVLATERRIDDVEAKEWIMAFYENGGANAPAAAYQAAAKSAMAKGRSTWSAFRWIGQP